jgi:23S rRNA maturation mini-RNase III
MGDAMFENHLFDHWLNQKSQDILTKMDKEQVTTEDMLILTLKAQTNHFHHMDVEFRDEFKKIDQRFNNVDKKFERLYSVLMWGFGLMLTSVFGLYIKMFLG